MASTDARPLPLKNTAYRLYFAIRKSDGTLITSWSGADSELSLDGASFSDATNEATEIGTSGVGYIDLTSGEMNADAVVLKTTVTNTGALPLVVTVFPEESTDRAPLTGDVWSATTRLLTAGTNIALAKGTGVTGFTDLDATGVRAAVGLATANLDTQLGTIDDFLDTEVAAIKAKTDLIPASPATESTLITIASYIDTEVAAIKAKTDALPSDPADQSALTATMATLATAANLATLTGYVDTEVAAIKAKTDLIPASPAAVGDIPSAATIADAVWDEAIAAHAASGSTGAALSDAGGGGTGGDPWGTALPGAYAAGTAGQLLGSNLTVATSSLATSAALATVAGYVYTEVAAIKAKTDGLPSDPADQSVIQATLATLATAANLATLTSYVDTEVAAIKAKTDGLPSDPADESSIQAKLATLATASALATVAGYVDTEVAAIKAKTDLIPASPASETTLGTLATAANLAIVDGVVDAILLDTAALDARVPAAPATQGLLTTVAGYVDTEVAAIKARTDLIPAAPAAAGDIPSAIAIADTLLDRVDGIESALTLRQALRLVVAASAGQLSGAATTTIRIRNFGDTKDRITAFVDDVGNRTGVTTDVS
jgi:cell division protein ZapA (FtsZ GTPase activity inhibitor)